MGKQEFDQKVKSLLSEHEKLISRKNRKMEGGNGIFDRYQYPVLTAAHTPVYWRYDLNYETNPELMERMGINATFNAGAIQLDGKFLLMVRVEGADRKSFFAVAESPNGIDRFKFWKYPVVLPETEDPDVNVYDMRLVKHEDGWIYGLFCTERHDPDGDIPDATAQGGIVRTKDLAHWERLDDLKTPSPQQRNVCLHPEFVDGKYAFYTRPMDEFITAGSGGGIGWGLADNMEHAVIEKEVIIEERRYHTINEMKNGIGPAPIKTEHGWLQLAHGVRNTAAGLRYTLYLFMTALNDPKRIIHRPGGLFVGPRGSERVGDVSNVTFANGWICTDEGEVFIYYASSDTRQHVATSTVDKLTDYCMNTPEDGLRSSVCVQQRMDLINRNLKIMKDLE